MAWTQREHEPSGEGDDEDAEGERTHRPRPAARRREIESGSDRGRVEGVEDGDRGDDKQEPEHGSTGDHEIVERGRGRLPRGGRVTATRGGESIPGCASD